MPYQCTAKISNQLYRTELEANGHKIISDVKLNSNGEDLGPDPEDLLLMSLSSCTAITLKMYAMRKEMDVQEILVDIKSVPSEDKVYTLVRKIDIIGNINDEQRAMLHRISEKCFVHKVLMNEVKIDTEIR